MTTINTLGFGAAIAIASTWLAGCAPEAPGEGCEDAASKGELWANGACLRGANIYQRRVYPELDGNAMGPGPVGPPYVIDDFERLASLGANFVDISHPGVYTEDPPYALDEPVLENLHAAVDGAAAAGLFSVISFRTGPGRNEFVFLDEEDPAWVGESLDDESVWQDVDAQAAWAAMWRATAERFRDHRGVVAYDLMVEPNANALVDAYDPGAFYPAYGGTAYDWNRFYPEIAAAIREVDAATPILVGALGWSDAEWLGSLAPIDDDLTAYAAHQYRPSVYTSQEPGAGPTYPGHFDADGDGVEEDVDVDWLLAALAPVRDFQALTGAPVAVNELGAARWAPGAALFVSDEIDVLEQIGASWALWLWYPSFEPWAESDEFSFVNGPDPARHSPDPDNALLGVVESAFSRNEAFLEDATW